MLIDKVREFATGIEILNGDREDLDYKMSQALIAADDLRKKFYSHEIDEVECLDLICDILESAKGDDDVK